MNKSIFNHQKKTIGIKVMINVTIKNIDSFEPFSYAELILIVSSLFFET